MNIKLWWEVAWFCKTPFVFFSDESYDRGTNQQVTKLKLQHLEAMKDFKYIKDKSDCDDAQAILKGEASKLAYNWVGTVSGWRGFRRHRFGILMTDHGLIKVEPQNIEQTDMKRYRALWVRF